jgi:hypothetical protein
MSRRGLWDRRGPGGDDADLDALLAGAWEDGAAAVARVLDIEGGKSALLTAMRGQRPGRSSWQQESPDDGAVAAVCAEVDVLLAIITAEGGPDAGPAHSTAMPYLVSVRKFLIQLRAGLAGRRLAKAEALQLAGSIRHGLSEATRTLRMLPPGVIPAGGQEAGELAGVVAGMLERLPALSGQIERLFDEAGDAAPRVPVPR